MLLRTYGGENGGHVEDSMLIGMAVIKNWMWNSNQGERKNKATEYRIDKLFFCSLKELLIHI